MKHYIFLISYLAASGITYAQKITFGGDDGIAIRKTFDGSKSEQKPANILLNRDFGNNLNFLNLDLAAKWQDVEVLPKTNVILIMYPKVEWHYSDQNEKKNSLSGGFNFEFFPGSGDKIKPWFYGSADYEGNFVQSNEKIKLKGFVSLFGTNSDGKNKLIPGSKINRANTSLLFRYYPYSGIEYYSLTNTGSKQSSIWASRVFFELYPIEDYLQMTFEYSYRKTINDNLFNKHNMHWISTGLNYYPAKNKNIGIGLEFNSGDNPNNDFIVSRIITIGLKVKY